MKVQAVLLTALGIGLTLALLLGGTWLGPAAAVFNLLTPVPAVYLGMRFGASAAVVVVAVVGLLLAQLAPLYSLLAYLSLFGAGSILLPLLLRRRMAWDWAALYSTLAGAAVMLIMVVAAIVMVGSDLGTVIGGLVQTEVDQAMQMYRDAGFSAAQLQEMQQLVDQIAAFIRQSFFGLYLAGLLAIQLLSLLLVHRLNRGDYQIYGIPFARWKLPAVLIWVLILAGFALLVPFAPLGLVGRNLLAILLPLYFLQGLAVVNHMLQRKGYSPLLRGLIYLMVFIFNPLPLIITGVGVFDFWFEFRRPRRKKV